MARGPFSSVLKVEGTTLVGMWRWGSVSSHPVHRVWHKVQPCPYKHAQKHMGLKQINQDHNFFFKKCKDVQTLPFELPMGHWKDNTVCYCCVKEGVGNHIWLFTESWRKEAASFTLSGQSALPLLENRYWATGSPMQLSALWFPLDSLLCVWAKGGTARVQSPM